MPGGHPHQQCKKKGLTPIPATLPRATSRVIRVRMLKLKKRSLDWALKHAVRFGDTDVFPHQFEFEAIKHDWKDISKFLVSEDIHNWKTRPLRSLLSPKSRYGFRIITQLDPLDFLIFAALVYEIGGDLEAHRVPVRDKIVYSHRFNPDSDGRM